MHRDVGDRFNTEKQRKIKNLELRTQAHLSFNGKILSSCILIYPVGFYSVIIEYFYYILANVRHNPKYWREHNQQHTNLASQPECEEKNVYGAIVTFYFCYESISRKDVFKNNLFSKFTL